MSLLDMGGERHYPMTDAVDQTIDRANKLRDGGSPEPLLEATSELEAAQDRDAPRVKRLGAHRVARPPRARPHQSRPDRHLRRAHRRGQPAPRQRHGAGGDRAVRARAGHARPAVRADRRPARRDRPAHRDHPCQHRPTSRAWSAWPVTPRTLGYPFSSTAQAGCAPSRITSCCSRRDGPVEASRTGTSRGSPSRTPRTSGSGCARGRPRASSATTRRSPWSPLPGPSPAESLTPCCTDQGPHR